MSLSLADFPDHLCQRRTFTKIKRGPSAIQWCSWCRKLMKLAAPCPVETEIIAAHPKEPKL